jgi:hypothetical protein
MKVTFVVFGLMWLSAIVALLRGSATGTIALAAVAVATLWYALVGTLMSALGAHRLGDSSDGEIRVDPTGLA